MLGKFSRQQQANGSLCLATIDGGSLVVVRQSARFSGYPLEDVIHDRHRLTTDSGVWVHLFQHCIDVYLIALRLWRFLSPARTSFTFPAFLAPFYLTVGWMIFLFVRWKCHVDNITLSI